MDKQNKVLLTPLKILNSRILSEGSNLWLLNNVFLLPKDGDYYGTSNQLVSHSRIMLVPITDPKYYKMITQSELGSDPGSGNGDGWFSTANYSSNRCVPVNKIIYRNLNYTIIFTNWNMNTVRVWNLYNGRPSNSVMDSSFHGVGNKLQYTGGLKYVNIETLKLEKCRDGLSYYVYYKNSAGNITFKDSIIYRTTIHNYSV